MKSKFIVAVLVCTCAVANALVPAPMVLIRGTVMDDPYPMRRMSMPISSVKAVLRTSTGAFLDSTRSTAQGQFVFRLAPAGPFLATFSHPSFRTLNIRFSTFSDTALNVAMVAATSRAAVVGTVLGGCNCCIDTLCIPRPQAGTTVTLEQGVMLSAAFPDSVAAASRAVYTTTTDRSGHFRFDSIPLIQNGERVYVTASVAGHTPQTIDTVIRNASTVTVNFVLTQPQTFLGQDTVTVSPNPPTTRDSLLYSLSLPNECCCAQFRDNAVSVFDTIIYLHYAVDRQLCEVCRCLIGGATAVFKGGRLAAGRYAIYKAESYYCPPGMACPALAILPQWVGSLTVVPPTSVASQHATTATSPLGVAWDGRSVMVNALLERTSRVSVVVYDAAGRLVSRIHEGISPAGRYQAVWQPGAGRSAGTYLVTVRINGKESTRAVVIGK